MQIIVTGARGVIGRAAVPLLVTAGHRVRGLSRSAANDTLLTRLGAEPVAVDLADAAGLQGALAGCDAVLHLAPKIPPSSAARKETSWLENDRLRHAGTNTLVDAALTTGGRTLPGCVWHMLAGKALVELLGRSQRVSNRASKGATGWSPAVPSLHVGVPPLLGALSAAPQRPCGDERGVRPERIWDA